MDAKGIAFLLVEKDQNVHKDARIFVDRLLHRFFAFPALMVYLSDINILDDNTVEIEFNRIPDESLDNIKKMIGVPYDQIEVYAYDKKEHPKYTFKVRLLNDEDLTRNDLDKQAAF